MARPLSTAACLWFHMTAAAFASASSAQQSVPPSPTTPSPTGDPPLVLLAVETGWRTGLAPRGGIPLYVPDRGVEAYLHAWGARSGLDIVLHSGGSLSNMLLALSRATKQPWAMAPEEREAWIHIRTLYERYAHDLAKVRTAARAFAGELAARGHTGLLSDLEAEMTYLRVRELRPRRVLELSPYCGYSSFWLLSALADNDREAERRVESLHGVADSSGTGGGSGGVVDAYDMLRCAERMLPRALVTRRDGSPRWRLHVGDATELIPRHLAEMEHAAAAAAAAAADGYSGAEGDIGYDYLFMDSDHSPAFAMWYIDNIFERHHRLRPSLHASVHDIWLPTGGISEEGSVVCAWLAEKAA